MMGSESGVAANQQPFLPYKSHSSSSAAPQLALLNVSNTRNSLLFFHDHHQAVKGKSPFNVG
jgi:hypothetical protein